jgi:hypothetical protein
MRSVCGRALLLAAVVCAGTGRAAEPSRLIVPAYGNPCCGSGRELWQALIDAARPGVLDVILNPDSGPGQSPIETNYIQADGRTGPLIELAERGASILGYVHTSYGRRELADVLAEIDRYYDAEYYRGAAFRPSGIFIDEMSNDLADLAYYQSIRRHLRAKSDSAALVGNPGVSSVLDSSRGAAGWTVDDYATLYDRLVTFEDNALAYRNAFSLPAWVRGQPASRFAHIVHTESLPEKLTIDLQLAAARNVGTLYVTDDVLPNPYDRVPSFWSELLAAVVPPVSIDELSVAVRTARNNPHYDLNRDGQVDARDRDYWVDVVAHTTYGDANLDGRFDSADLVAVFQAGQYEDGVPGNSLWATGDWNGDGDFTSSDLTVALQRGGYENTAVPVAEPGGAASGLMGCLVWLTVRRLRKIN